MLAAKNIIIAGGGTGGHIYPGIAIARALIAKDPNVKIHFVGSPDGMEIKIIPKENFPLHLIRVGKLNFSSGWRGRIAKLVTLLSLPFAFIQSRLLLWKLNPTLVIGVGGYVSGPFLLTAALSGYKSFVWEPNAVPGMTNRWLAKFVKACLVVFPAAKSYLPNQNVIEVGMPVRKEIDEILNSKKTIEIWRKEVQSEFNTNELSLKPKLNILVFGGSQGAQSMNKIFREYFIDANNSAIQVIHQTGKWDYSEILESYKGQKNLLAKEYLHPMEKYYAWADLIFCRAGASTVAEIAAARKATVFIPLPWAADNHQFKNAESLVQSGAAEMILQADLNKQTISNTINKYLIDHNLQEVRKTELAKFHHPQAGLKIAEYLLGT